SDPGAGGGPGGSGGRAGPVGSGDPGTLGISDIPPSLLTWCPYTPRTCSGHNGDRPSDMMNNVAEGSGKGLVLVVEDERPIAELVRLYLARDGYGVHVEHDGDAGLAAARRLRPVACVLDIRLPGTDGTEICRRLREAGDWTPIIFLTARDDEVDR